MRWVALVLALSSVCFAGEKKKIVVPDKVLDAKTMAIVLYWPQSNTSEQQDIYNQADDFFAKWGRYKLVKDANQADIIAVLTVSVNEAGYAPTMASSIARAFSVAGQQMQCQDTCIISAPPLTYQTVYSWTGSVLLFDAKQFLAEPKTVEPLWVERQSGGNKPLMDAAKKIQQYVKNGDDARQKTRTQ